jgi:hypothetical protein
VGADVRKLKKFLDLKFELEADKAKSFLGGMAARIDALFTGIPTDVGGEVGAEMKAGILDNFVNEGNERDGAWRPLSKKYAEWKDEYFPGEPIGQRTHQLIESISFRVDSGAVVAGVMQGGKKATSIHQLYKHETGNGKSYHGVEELPTADMYAASFNETRNFLVIPADRIYNLKRTIWYWVVQGKVHTSGFGRDLA